MKCFSILFITCTLCLTLQAIAQDAATKPPYERLLQGEDAKKSAELRKAINDLHEEDKFTEAIKLQEEDLALRTRIQGADHWQTVERSWQLDFNRKLAALPAEKRRDWRKYPPGAFEAQVLESAGKYEEAEPFWREHLRRCEEDLGAKHFGTLAAIDLLADNLTTRRKYAEAQVLHEETLKLSLELLGETHPMTASSYYGVALDLDGQKKYVQAEPLFAKSLELRRGILGERHPATATSYDKLGLCLYDQEKYAESAPYLQKALEIRRQLLGEKHVDTAESYNNLALSLHSQRQLVAAQPHFQKALDLRRALLGEKHRATAASYHNLGENLLAQKKYVEAKPCFEQAVQLRLELLGKKNSSTINSVLNLAANQSALGNLPESHLLYLQALDLNRNLWGEKHVETAQCYTYVGASFQVLGKHAEAEPYFRTALALKRELLPEKHLSTAASYSDLAIILHLQNKLAEAEPLFRKTLELRRELLGPKHLDTADSYLYVAENLYQQAKYVEAEPHFQHALEILQEQLGEGHPATIRCNEKLGLSLYSRGKYLDSQTYFQKVLDANRKLHGEKHPTIADCYNYIGRNLYFLGQHSDAEPLFQKALELNRELLSEKHLQTATTYLNIAANRYAQGNYAEAQVLYERALKTHREIVGHDKDLGIAMCYNNLAANLQAQGKYSEAQEFFQKAFDIHLELLGEKHEAMALAYTNLAANLYAQKKYPEAQRFYQQALDIRLALFGEKHPGIATTYNNMFANLAAQEKYEESQLLIQKANEMLRELFGEEHPETALSYSNLAGGLFAQGKYVDAQPFYEKALELDRNLLGNQHPKTVQDCKSLAENLTAQRQFAASQLLLAKAAKGFEAARLNVAGRGLERAAYGSESSPYPLLAANLAQLRAPTTAWAAAEANLARGLSEEAALRGGSTLSPEDQALRDAVSTKLQQLQPRILELVLKQMRTQADQQELATLREERQKLEARLSELAVALSRRDRASFAQVQAALQPETALILWVDSGGTMQEHWGCVVRASGEPKWERLPGTGPDGRWTKADTKIPADLRTALAENGSAPEIAGLSKQLYTQRLAPLAKHLAGIKSLYIVPVNSMAGIPVEALTTEYAISYVPSGTFLTRLKERGKPSGSAMLAVADPIFMDPAEKPKGPASLPPGGLLVMFAVPGGAGEKAGLKSGDVLLKYGDTELTDVDTLLKAIAANTTAKTMPVTIWREDADKPLVQDVAAGKLGLALEKDPAPVAITNRRKTDGMLFALRGGDWGDLPGTRVEASRIGKIFGSSATLLADTSASEQKLEAIRQAGDLKKYRYLHFATHGEGNNVRAFESTLILAQDDLPKDPLPKLGEPFINGQLSASEVLEYWKLDAELVTLSACETAVGSQGGGDGPLGFAQAFLTAGSRAVCLSLWKVDDTATTLLMDRFYQNLLGKRPGLDKPLGKAAALAEAKNWLRNLSSDEALQLTANMINGVVRAKKQKALPKATVPQPDDPADAKNFKPFDHPKYWAAFILIGDPS